MAWPESERAWKISGFGWMPCAHVPRGAVRLNDRDSDMMAANYEVICFGLPAFFF